MQHREQAAQRADGAGTRRAQGAPARAHGGREAMLELQRLAGNAAVARVVQDHGNETPIQRLAVHQVLRSRGRRLDPGLQDEMQNRFGGKVDFSTVEVHTGPLADRAAREMGANAFTSGENVVLRNGVTDKHTLAHELTHVIQQRQGPVAGTDHGDGLSVSNPRDPYELAAEKNARDVMQRRLP